MSGLLGDSDSPCLSDSEFPTDIIRLTDMDWIGFDLDHTLIRYNLNELLPLLYRCICSSLVEKCGVSSAALDVPYDFGFCERGLVFDALTGDLLKLDATGIVRRACHGYCSTFASSTNVSVTRKFHGFLSEDELCDRYGSGPWRALDELRSNWKADGADIWVTLFDVPACQACALLVDEADRQASLGTSTSCAREAYAQILPSIRKAMHEHLRWQNFSEKQGGYFPRLAEDPSKFVLNRESVRRWLEQLRSVEGKRLFLLTNSNWDYADLVMSAAFGSDWRGLFQLITYRASKKGSFFHHQRPFKPFDDKSLAEGEPTFELRVALDSGHREFVEGNVKTISELFGDDARVIYFGDDLNGDVAVIHRFSSWRTVAVVEELAEHARTTHWGPVLSFASDDFEPRKSCTLRSFCADDAFEEPKASHILEMIAATADFTVPDLAAVAAYPINHSFEHGDVFYGSVLRGTPKAALDRMPSFKDGTSSMSSLKALRRSMSSDEQSPHA